MLDSLNEIIKENVLNVGIGLLEGFAVGLYSPTYVGKIIVKRVSGKDFYSTGEAINQKGLIRMADYVKRDSIEFKIPKVIGVGVGVPLSILGFSYTLADDLLRTVSDRD